MLVPQAIEGGLVAATNAVRGDDDVTPMDLASPIGSFTDPEYARGSLMTEAEAHQNPRCRSLPWCASTRLLAHGARRWPDGRVPFVDRRPRDTAQFPTPHNVGEPGDG